MDASNAQTATLDHKCLADLSYPKADAIARVLNRIEALKQVASVKTEERSAA